MPKEGPTTGIDSLLELGDTLQSLPDEKFLAVIDTLAVVSEQGPVALLMEEARPRLRVLKPHRPRSLKRPLCRPFEDLFVNRPGVAPGHRPIDRTVIQPLWLHLERSDGATLRALQGGYKQQRHDAPQQSLEIAARTWALAARVLAAAPIPGVDPEASAILRDIFAAAPVIEEFRHNFPRKPILLLGDSEKALIKQQLEALAANGTAIRGYLLIVAARLASPPELLLWLRDAGQPVAPVVEQFAVGSVDDVMTEFAAEVGDLDPEDLVAEAQSLLTLLATAEEGVVGANRKALKERAEMVKGKMREALKTQLIETAPGEISAALADDVSRETLIAAETYARALAKARKTAGQIGLGSATTTAISTVRRNCLGRIDDLLKPASGGGGPAPLTQIRSGVFQSVRLIELVDGASSGREILADAMRRMKALPR
jgi:hypothetical protein